MRRNKADIEDLVFGVRLDKDELVIDWCGKNTYELLGRGKGRMQTNVAHVIGTALGHCLKAQSQGDQNAIFRFLCTVNEAAIAEAELSSEKFPSVSIG